MAGCNEYPGKGSESNKPNGSNLILPSSSALNIKSRNSITLFLYGYAYIGHNWAWKGSIDSMFVWWLVGLQSCSICILEFFGANLSYFKPLILALLVGSTVGNALKRFLILRFKVSLAPSSVFRNVWFTAVPFNQ